MKTLVLLSLILAQVPYIETLEVSVHSVDVVVTDAQGKPVPGLTRDDFQIFEDGVEQRITNFSAFHGGPVSSRAESRDPLVPAGDASTALGMTPAAEAKRAPRKFIFYVDEMSLSSPVMKQLETQLGKLIDTTMEPGDEAMILRPAEEKKLTAPFSGDRAAVRKALLETIRDERWRADAPILRELRLLENEMRGVSSHISARIAARRWAGLVRARVQQRLGHLNAVVNGASGIEGRKVLVLVAESLPVEPGKEAFTAYSDVVSVEANQGGDPTAVGGGDAFADWTTTTSYESNVDWVSLKPLVNEIARSASTNGITIYTIQPEYGLDLLLPGGNIGATTPGRDAGSAQQQRSRPASSARLTAVGMTKFVEHMSTNTENALRPLAELTGGTWQRGGVRADNLVNAITSDVQSYYSLGYRAGEDVDRPHRLEVRVKGRPELRVRTRQEVLRKSPEREMTDRVVASLLVPPATNEMNIRLESKQTGVAPDRQYKTVMVAARVPLSALTFLPEGDKLKARFTVHYAVSGQDTDFVSGVHGTQVVEVPADKFEEVKSQNWTYVVPFNLRPAKHSVAIGVLDSLSNMSGFSRIDLDLR
ncbi:MAG TPA: VWA domain-containing protein [Thermoanaerobaculia bacterium]|nr:VWA domain-containing protein [Thermoanaerobaculia bacterium]